MKHQSTYRSFFGRKNILKHFILNAFIICSSLPRLCFEVFLRRNFGERYFNLASAFTVAVVLGLYPAITHKISSYGYEGGGDGFWSTYATWYLFLMAFCYFAYLRWQEGKRLPSIFELARFTKHDGDIHPFFYGLRFFGKRPTERQIEIVYEPAGFFLAGILLSALGQPIGMLLIGISIIYSLGYAGQFMQGDEKIMDALDDILIKEQMYSVILGGLPSSETKGVGLDGRLPESEEHRQMLYDYLMNSENDNTSTAM